MVAKRIGGQVIGAFDGDTQIGFAMSLPGYRDGKPYLHSHMLAVLPQYRNEGIGRRLKLAQRDDAIARGFDLMEWTLNPLEIRNAHLNIARLGAIVRRYEPNFYGPSSSPLQGGLPTDRLYAEWWLRSSRVASICAVRSPNDGNPGTRLPAHMYARVSRRASAAHLGGADAGDHPGGYVNFLMPGIVQTAASACSAPRSRWRRS